ncbi:hypothetical protein PRIPAC_90756 [Pristionchus pacificus]|uniref:Uncharacterized protein n=1 Tax=Pristionchus pacificus TaxID=54126 RepID=A0A2A6B3N0_PRIPA|nr:hypothetical protein PRIPAC_90756 [Pristionchus pacificus]|eukprot:PDM60463.1 hypothetical protein PRIPAC_53441 [Pristionchus pacificus]
MESDRQPLVDEDNDEAGEGPPSLRYQAHPSMPPAPLSYPRYMPTYGQEQPHPSTPTTGQVVSHDPPSPPSDASESLLHEGFLCGHLSIKNACRLVAVHMLADIAYCSAIYPAAIPYFFPSNHTGLASSSPGLYWNKYSNYAELIAPDETVERSYESRRSPRLVNN